MIKTLQNIVFTYLSKIKLLVIVGIESETGILAKDEVARDHIPEPPLF